MNSVQFLLVEKTMLMGNEIMTLVGLLSESVLCTKLNDGNEPRLHYSLPFLVCAVSYSGKR